MAKSETTGEYIDDSMITSKVHTIIVKDPDAHYLKIDVTTAQRDVVQQGFVNRNETEKKACGKNHENQVCEIREEAL